MKTITIRTEKPFVPAKTLRCECNSTHCSVHPHRRSCKGEAVAFGYETIETSMAHATALCNGCADEAVANGAGLVEDIALRSLPVDQEEVITMALIEQSETLRCAQQHI